MKVEYLHDLTDGGKFKQVVSENLIRLYDFDQVQTKELADLIFQKLIVDKVDLDLSTLGFIELMNCKLVFTLSLYDKGVLKTNQPNKFVCELTAGAYLNSIDIMNKIADGHNWLCSTSDDNIDLLFSLGGMW